MRSVSEMMEDDFEKEFDHATICSNLSNVFEAEEQLEIDGVNHQIRWKIIKTETKTTISLNTMVDVEYLNRSLKRLLAICGFNEKYKYRTEKGNLYFLTEFKNEDYLQIELHEIVKEFTNMTKSLFLLVNDSPALEECLKENKSIKFRNVPPAQIVYELKSDKAEDQRENRLSQEGGPEFARFIINNDIDELMAERALRYHYPKFEAQINRQEFTIDLSCKVGDYVFSMDNFGHEEDYDYENHIKSTSTFFLILFRKARGKETSERAEERIRKAIRQALQGISSDFDY